MGAVTLRLGHDCRYTPDYVCASEGPGEWEINAFEVKGFQRDDAMVKLRVAAREYPWIRFHLVTGKPGAWQIQEVPR